MIAFFDSNVFDYIAKASEPSLIRSELDSRGIEVLASHLLLVEAIVIKDRRIREQQLSCITRLATRYEDKPIAYRQALELRSEIERCRPDWLRARPSVAAKRRVREFVRQQQADWQLAKIGELSPGNLDEFKQDSESGISSNSRVQKTLRVETVVHRRPKKAHGYLEANGQRTRFDLNEPDSFWRWECACVWHSAMVERVDHSRDYYDYLSPYVNEDAFADEAYCRFWKREVDAARMPLNRIPGLVSYYQLEHRISHGNSYDALHATFCHDVDIFLTADKAFFSVLADLRELAGQELATPLFVDRRSSDSLDELKRVLDSIFRDS